MSAFPSTRRTPNTGSTSSNWRSTRRKASSKPPRPTIGTAPTWATPARI